MEENIQDIEGLYSLESTVASGLFADFFKVKERSTNQTCLLWVSNSRIDPEGPYADAFIHRIISIQESPTALTEVVNFGVDPSGRYFVTLPYLDGEPLIEIQLKHTERERIYMGCLQLVTKFHEQNICCGDISDQSFLIDRTGSLKFIGILGCFQEQNEDLSNQLGLDKIVYLAPEFSANGELSLATDVYAFGVLGLAIFLSDIVKLGSEEFRSLVNEPFLLDEYLLNHQDQLPTWFSKVLPKMLSSDPRERYQDLPSLLAEITTHRQTHELVDQSRQNIAQSKVETHPEFARSLASKTVSKNLRLLLTLLFSTILISTSLYLVYQKFLARQNIIAEEIEQLRLVNPELAQAIEDSLASNDPAEHERAFNLLAQTEDPLAQHALVRVAQRSEIPEQRKLAEQAILARARRQGLVLTAEIIRNWLLIPQVEMMSSYTTVLAVIDRAIPNEELMKNLKDVQQSDPDLSLKIAVALAFDTEDLTSWQPFLAQALNAKNQNLLNGNFSALALIMSDADLSLYFEDKVNQLRDTLRDTDILPLLEVLANRDDANLRAIANLVLERKLLSSTSSIALEVLRDQPEVRPEIAKVLIRVALDRVESSDLDRLRSWYAVEAERVILVVLANTSKAGILSEAFDTLAGKSPTIEPSAGILRWVRTYAWDQRAKFARVIGVLGIAEKVETDKILQILSSLDSYIANDEFLQLLMNSDSSILLQYLLERHAQRIDLGTKLNLLKHKQAEVRMSAVEAIDTNDINALKMIVSAYETEKDPQVKKSFQKFWMIKERMNKHE